MATLQVTFTPPASPPDSYEYRFAISSSTPAYVTGATIGSPLFLTVSNAQTYLVGIRSVCGTIRSTWSNSSVVTCNVTPTPTPTHTPTPTPTHTPTPTITPTHTPTPTPSPTPTPTLVTGAFRILMQYNMAVTDIVTSPGLIIPDFSPYFPITTSVSLPFTGSLATGTITVYLSGSHVPASSFVSSVDFGSNLECHNVNSDSQVIAFTLTGSVAAPSDIDLAMEVGFC